jgi:hypothetical protein
MAEADVQEEGILKDILICLPIDWEREDLPLEPEDCKVWSEMYEMRLGLHELSDLAIMISTPPNRPFCRQAVWDRLFREHVERLCEWVRERSPRLAAHQMMDNPRHIIFAVLPECDHDDECW